MLHITRDAAHMCSESVRQLSVLANTKLPRFRRNCEGVSIALEAPQSGDEIVYFAGKAVLAVPEEIAGALSDMTLDVSEAGVLVLAQESSGAKDGDTGRASSNSYPGEI